MKPLLFLSFKDSFHETKDGTDFLSSIKTDKLSLITIIGPKNTGKSSLWNQLAQIKELSLSNNKEHTVRIYQMPQQEDGTSVLLLDASGFDEYIKFTRSLSQLCILISSTIIYNDTVTEKATNSLEVFVKEMQNEGNKLTRDNLPQFIYLLRDAEQGEATTNSILKVLHDNNIYQTFINVKYSSLPRPQLDEKGNVSLGKSIEYIKAFENFKDNILLRNLPNKHIDLININGNLVYNMIHYYIKRINENKSIKTYKAATGAGEKIEALLAKIEQNHLNQFLRGSEETQLSSIFRTLQTTMTQLLTTSLYYLSDNNDIINYISGYMIDLLLKTQKAIQKDMNRSFAVFLDSLIIEGPPNKGTISLETIKTLIKTTFTEIASTVDQMASFLPLIKSSTDPSKTKVNDYIEKHKESILSFLNLYEKFEKNSSAVADKERLSKQNEEAINEKSALQNKIMQLTETISHQKNEINRLLIEQEKNKTVHIADIEYIKSQYQSIKLVVDYYKRIAEDLGLEKNDCNILGINKEIKTSLEKTVKQILTVLQPLKNDEEKVSSELKKAIKLLKLEEENMEDLLNLRSKTLDDYIERNKKMERDINAKNDKIEHLTKKLEEMSKVNNEAKIVESEIEFLLVIFENILNNETELYYSHAKNLNLPHVKKKIESFARQNKTIT